MVTKNKIKRPIPVGVQMQYRGEALEIYLDASGGVDYVRVTGVLEQGDGFRARESREYHRVPVTERVPGPDGLPITRKTTRDLPLTAGQLTQLANILSAFLEDFEKVE